MLNFYKGLGANSEVTRDSVLTIPCFYCASLIKLFELCLLNCFFVYLPQVVISHRL